MSLGYKDKVVERLGNTIRNSVYSAYVAAVTHGAVTMATRFWEQGAEAGGIAGLITFVALNLVDYLRNRKGGSQL